MKRQSLRLQPTVKTKMKLSTRYLVVGSTFLIVSIIGVFLYLNLAGHQNAQAATNEPAIHVNHPEATEILSVSLQSTNGQVLMQQQALASEKAVDVEMSKELPAGLYLLRVKGKKAESQSISLHLAPSK